MMTLTQVNTTWSATAIGGRSMMPAGFPNDDTVLGSVQRAIRVFVVEDEAVISMDLCERLTSLGYVVCGSASRGEVAVEKILEIKPNLVLMDINLAGKISGVDAAERIRAHYRVPVVFLTAYSGAELITRASSSGGYGYLVKPFEKRELHATIQVALTRFEYDCRLGEINATLEEQVRLRTAELETALHAAEEANRAKTVFLRNMNHELRTPLHQILLLAELLATNASLADEKATWCLENISRSGKHLAQLIEQLLDLSAMDGRAALPLHIEAVDPSVIVGEAVAMVQSLADGTGIMLENVTGPAGRLTVLANRDSLRQVVITLLSNAIRYNRQGGSVRVETCVLDGNMTSISVSDTGLGLTEEQLRSAFDPLVRFVPEGEVIDGLGIGLTVARQLAERMKGRIEASSVPGKGSRFSVVLPSAGSGQP